MTKIWSPIAQIYINTLTEVVNAHNTSNFRLVAMKWWTKNEVQEHTDRTINCVLIFKPLQTNAQLANEGQ